MWKKLYSNSGLILLAVLGAGIWFSNLRAIYPPKPVNDFDVVHASSPTPTLSIEEALKLPPVSTPSPPTPSAVEIYEREQRSGADFGESMRQRRLSATALCADGTYSYSANRRGACSHHGGVAQWLRQSPWGNAARKIRSLFAK